MRIRECILCGSLTGIPGIPALTGAPPLEMETWSKITLEEDVLTVTSLSPNASGVPFFRLNA